MTDPPPRSNRPLLRVELHAHTSASPDCRLKPHRLVEVLAERGIDALAVTDHNTMDGAFALAELQAIPLILGEEIKSTEGDIIGLFLRQPIERDLSPAETVRAIKEQGGLVLVPHPFDSLRRSALGQPAIESILADIDVLEVFNGRTIRDRDNATAGAFARDHGLAASVGSDSHLVVEVGRSWQCLPAWDGPADFLQGLRAAELHTSLAPKWVHLGSSFHAYSTKAEKRLRRLIGR